MIYLPRDCKYCGASLMHYGRCGCPGEKAARLPTDFENALCDLVEMYLRDGLAPKEVNAVLRARADDDYEQFASELLRRRSEDQMTKPTPRMDGTAAEQLQWRVEALREALSEALTCDYAGAMRAVLRNGLLVDDHNAKIDPRPDALKVAVNHFLDGRMAQFTDSRTVDDDLVELAKVVSGLPAGEVP